jgi:flagellar FliL protein
VAEEKPAVTQSGPAPHPAAGEKGTPKKFPPSSLRLLIITAVLYAGAVFASFGVTAKILAPKLSPWLAQRLVEEVRAQEAATHPEKPPFGQIYLVEDLVVNPFLSGGTRYACISVGLESSVPQMGEELRVRDAQVKDILIQIFSSKTVDELADYRYRETIRQEVRERIEGALPGLRLDAVYFVNFVLQ